MSETTPPFIYIKYIINTYLLLGEMFSEANRDGTINFCLCRSFFFFFVIKRKGKNGKERKRKTCGCFLHPRCTRLCFICSASPNLFTLAIVTSWHARVFCRVRVALATVGLVSVQACPQQPFNPTPEGYYGYQFNWLVFSFFGGISFSLFVK